MVDWGDNTTAITGLSDLAYPPDLMGRWGEDVSGGSGGGSSNTTNPEEDSWRFKCHRYIKNHMTPIFSNYQELRLYCKKYTLFSDILILG